MSTSRTDRTSDFKLVDISMVVSPSAFMPNYYTLEEVLDYTSRIYDTELHGQSSLVPKDTKMMLLAPIEDMPKYLGSYVLWEQLIAVYRLGCDL